MSARETLLQEIALLPEPMIEETLLFVRLAVQHRDKASLKAESAKRSINPLQTHPELAGRILYDPMEPATEADWPTSAR